MKKTFFFYLLLCSLCGTVAQANIYFKHLGKSDGLSQISVMSISQDELGRMWFGTFEGLNCWDGTTMTVYNPSEEPDGVFTGGGVFDLVCDKRGSVFFISSNRLVRYDLQNERFIKELSHASCIHSVMPAASIPAKMKCGRPAVTVCSVGTSVARSFFFLIGCLRGRASPALGQMQATGFG